MKLKKNRKLQGSVLLTVVSVMALLIIFMASTVTLANAANNRSHANYSDSQAEYTAKTAIEGFSQALSTNDALAQSILAMKKGDTFTPAVVINNAGMGNIGYYNGDEWISDRIKVEYIKNNWGYDKEKSEWANMQVLKVTATAKVGKEEKSVCYYLEKTGESAPVKSDGIKGFQTVGGGGTNNNGIFSGALCLGLGEPDEIEVSPGNVQPVVYNTRNDFKAYCTDCFVNGSIHQVAGNNFEWYAYTPDSHFVVTRDLGILNSGFHIYVNYPYATTGSDGKFQYKDVTQKSIPYLYVGGRLTSVSEGGNLGAGGGYLQIHNDSADNARGKYKSAPFNVFADSMSLSQVVLDGADLYLFDDDPSVTSYPCGDDSVQSKNNTALYSWSSSVLNKTSNQFYSEGGSIYCNHNLEFRQAAKIHGDLVVQGDLRFKDNGATGNAVEVFGDLAVNGKIYNNGSVDNLSALKVHGKIYYNAGSVSSAFAKRNPEKTGGLKAGYVQVDNIELGGYEVDNIEVLNTPVEGGKVETVDNPPLAGVKRREVSKNHIVVKYDWGSQPDSNNWRYEDTQELVGDLDFELVSNWVGYHQAFVYSYNGQVYPGPLYEDNDTHEMTTSPKAYYYVTADGRRIRVHGESADHLFYLAKPDGTVTDEVVDSAYVYYIADKNGEATAEYTTDPVVHSYYLYNPAGEVTDRLMTGETVYYVVDPATNKPEEPYLLTKDSTSYYYYNSENKTYELSTEAAAMETGGEKQYVCWYDPKIPATAEYYYYDVDPDSLSTGDINSHQITAAEALNKANTSYLSVSSYRTYARKGAGFTIYPKNMEKAALNSGSTKIVKQHSEAVADIGGKAENIEDPSKDIFEEGAYNSNYDYSSITNKIDISTKTGTLVIDQPTVLYGTSNNDLKVIRIKPTDGMFVVLKDTYFTTNSDVKIVVEGNQIVNFFLDGEVKFDKGGIYTKRIYDDVQANRVIRISESDKMNINMYGAKNSKLTFKESNWIMCANARCPFTTVYSPEVQGLKAEWRYVDNYNHIMTPSHGAVNWVGSGLFDSSSSVGAFFTLLYTNSAGSGGNGINNGNVKGANWYAKYYDAY